jgi:hypothetical protein
VVFPATNELKKIILIILIEGNSTLATHPKNLTEKGINHGALAGIVVAAAILLALLTAIAIYLNRRRKARTVERAQGILVDQEAYHIGDLHELHREEKLGPEMLGEEMNEMHGQHHQELEATLLVELHDMDSGIVKVKNIIEFDFEGIEETCYNVLNLCSISLKEVVVDTACLMQDRMTLSASTILSRNTSCCDILKAG